MSPFGVTRDDELLLEGQLISPSGLGLRPTATRAQPETPWQPQPVFRLRPDAGRFFRALGALFFAAFFFRGVRA